MALIGESEKLTDSWRQSSPKKYHNSRNASNQNLFSKKWKEHDQLIYMRGTDVPAVSA